MQTIVILGGGTAGWLAALLTQRAYPEHIIKLIEREEIGILGAGEGTVPDFINVIKYADISVEEVVKHCDATLKLGILFSNWNGDGGDYFHEFTRSIEYDAPRWSAYSQMLSQGTSIKDIQPAWHFAQSAKSPFSVNEGTVLQHNPYALHFNARKLADFFSKVAQQRGVERIQGKMVSVCSHDNHDIRGLVLEDGTEITGDFFFDCSGFARLLIGKHFNEPWNSYREYLPLDTALPFFIPHDNTNIQPHTEAIAMSSGWIWKIPVRDRYGCGYVFDSRFINEDQALAEAQQYFGQELVSPKTFRFNAGAHQRCLINNCLALGLSQSFIEPLEATSIWATCVNLHSFLLNDLLTFRTESAVELFNQRVDDRNQIIMEFIQHHYITQRQDSDFWRGFRQNNKILPSVMQRIQHWRDYGIMDRQNLVGFPPRHQSRHDMFEVLSWLQVSAGLEHFDPKPWNRIKKALPQNDCVSPIKNSIQSSMTKVMSHDDFLEICRGTSE